MYVPEEFLITEQSELVSFLKNHAFGAFLMNGINGFPMVTQIPFVVKQVEDKIVLEFHLAANNEQAAFIQEGALGKMLITGAHGYISSSVYTHTNVPTYNYASAHVFGAISKLDDQELKNHVRELVEEFEKNRVNPLQFDNWSNELISSYLKEIVGVRLSVLKMTGNFKLSQNRNTIDFENILHDIQKGNNALYEQMKSLCPKK